MLTFSIIGLGNRGSVYADNLMKETDVKIVAVCDVSPSSLLQAKEVYGVEDKNLFSDENEFFKEKRADVLIVATLDGLHQKHAIKGMSLGYDILLEKPIAPSYDECKAIKDACEKYKRDVVICHNLRYTPFYQKIKTIISSGEIGEVVSVEQSENVAYHHYMCSFIRGKWHSKQETSSIILQKCCHDLDIITWFVGNVDDKLDSFGDLTYYNKNHAPVNSDGYCVNCNVKDCIYNAYEFYCKAPECLCVPYGFDTGKENIKRYLSDKNNKYAKCVFKSENDVCDRQTVSITYDNGVTADLLMHGFANTTDRLTVVYGSKGVVYGDFNEGIVKVDLFDGKSYQTDVNAAISGDSHNGGDSKLVSDYVYYKKTGDRPLGISEIADSVKSHKLAFSAEDTRVKHVNHQNVIKVNYDYNINDSGTYKVAREFIDNGKIGDLQIIAFTVNVNKDKFSEKIKNDLAYAMKFVNCGVLNYLVNFSDKWYKHGFIDVYFENGVLIRYAITCQPLCEKTEMRFYGTKGVIVVEGKNVKYQSSTLFAEQEVTEINEVGGCVANEMNAFIEEIINKCK